MTTQTTVEETQDDAQEPLEPQDAPEGTEEPSEAQEDEADVFPRSYVQELRDESARYRQRAQRADDLAAALWTARVAATGRLADPTDLALPEDGDPLDTEAVTAAVEDLLARKPHLASRRPRGDVGQGMTGSTNTVDLAGILRSRA